MMCSWMDNLPCGGYSSLIGYTVHIQSKAKCMQSGEKINSHNEHSLLITSESWIKFYLFFLRNVSTTDDEIYCRQLGSVSCDSPLKFHIKEQRKEGYCFFHVKSDKDKFKLDWITTFYITIVNKTSFTAERHQQVHKGEPYLCTKHTNE